MCHQWDTGNLPEAGIDDCLASDTLILFKMVADNRLSRLCSLADHALANIVPVTCPESFGGFPAVQHETQRLAIFLKQENFPGFHFEMGHQEGQGFVHDLIKFKRRGQGRVNLIQQGQLFIATGESLITLLQVFIETGVVNCDPGIGRQHFDDRFIVVSELGRTDLISQVDLAQLPVPLADGHTH